MILGRIFTFPDTSNTCYSSYLEAAAEIIANLDFYVEYMHFIRDSKEKRTLNHLESNVLKGLEDLLTLTELATLALYQEAVSFSYISSVRSTGLTHTNTLELGPLQQRVKTHIKKLIDEPHLILSPDSDPCVVTLNGYESWKRANAVNAIHKISSELPHLEEIFQAFLSGALETWERFTSEFSDNGTIAALTEGEKELAWMPPTNDANEGALGTYQIFTQKNPLGTIKLFNSIFRFRRNDTQDFMDTMLTGHEHEVFLRKEARERDAMGLDRKRRREIHEEHMEDIARK